MPATKKRKRSLKKAHRSLRAGEITREATPAKVVRPQSARSYDRTRLFRELDRARTRPVVWVSAPPGAGKTTLIATYLEARRLPALWYQVDAGDGDPATFFHYLGLAAQHAAPRFRQRLPELTPEYLPALAVFSRRYFEALGARLKMPTVLVFDNFQEAPTDSPLQTILAEGLWALPKGINAIFLSRSDPPPALARLRASDAMAMLDGAALVLTDEEARGIARLHCPALDKKTIERFGCVTGGWTAGLMLLLERARAERAPLEPAGDMPTQAVFDYFAAEIFERMDAETRRILLHSAFLPKMTLPRVRRLTGSERAGAVLADLHRRNYFTVRHGQSDPAYEYHPLFRAFLLAHARESLGEALYRQVQRAAADILEADGAIEDAAALLQAARDWDGLAGVTERHAGTLLSHGRGQTVEAWLKSLPAETLEASPWLLYWLGMCRMFIEPSEARVYVERACRLFRAASDREGFCLAWGAVVDTYVYARAGMTALDGWIAEMEAFLRVQGAPPGAEAELRVVCGMFLALMYRQPQHPELPQWEQRVTRLVMQGSDDARLRAHIGTQLLHYHTWWSGDLGKGGVIVNALEKLIALPGTPALVATTWHMMSAAYCWMIAENDKAVATAQAGLRLANESGVHAMDLMMNSQAAIATLSSGRLDDARAFLEAVTSAIDPSRQLDNAVYHHLFAWHAMARDDLRAAVEHARLSKEYAERAGSPFFLAHILNVYGLMQHYAGDTDAGLDTVRQARALGEAQRSTTVDYLTWMIEAEIALERDEAACVEALRHCLAIGRAQKFQNHTWWRAPVMSRLYAKALAQGIETDYVSGVIRKRGLDFPPDGEAPERWPWAVRVVTLGPLSVVRDEAEVSFGGSSGRKPMELLAALIAFGARDVRQEQLSQALWPDAEGDAARRVFDTTLHRLRKLLGSDALVLRDGQLSLDARRCWVDARTLERLLEQAATLPAEHARLEKLVTRTLSLYRGPFLSTFEDASWAITERERLRSKFLRQLARLAQRWEQAGRWQEAADAYQRALEVEPLGEAFYRGLMRAHLGRGNRAEAHAVYRRCQNVLATIGVTPSPETAAVLL